MSENLMPHIRLPKDLDVDCALLPGDPARADAVATHLEDAELLASTGNFAAGAVHIRVKKCWLLLPESVLLPVRLPWRN